MASFPGSSSLDADMDSLLDYSGGNLQSPSSSMDPMSSMMSTEHAEERQILSGPSHEYGRFKQQTGLPSGAMSSMTAFGDMSADNDFMMSQGSFAQAANPNLQNFVSMDLGGYGSGVAFDMDYESTPTSAVPTFFFPGAGSEMNDFAESSGLPPTYNTPATNPQRLWPGMHSQQAEQARAEASARQQRQQMQGQQIMQQRQREQSISASSQVSNGSGKSRAPSHVGIDPVTDEPISRILDNMRHKPSIVSPIEEESNPLEDGASRAAKMRKDDEEMDEDERLLASEEGKKLSSKERRQLRNKVSARAFRSRRKEYISQLEGEVAAKVNECSELKSQNLKLADENNQLKHLTRTLLSHPAFQTFLEDMSRDQSIIAPFQSSLQSAQEMTSSSDGQSQSQQSVEQESTTSSKDTQVNVAGMPNDNLEFSMLDLGGNNHWGPGHTNFNFQQPQVFPVIDVPQGPSFDEITIPRIPSLKQLGQEVSEKVTKSSPTAAESTTSPVVSTECHTISSVSADDCFALYSESSPGAESLERKHHSKSISNMRNVTESDSPQCSPIARSPDSPSLSKKIDELFGTVDSSVERIDRLISNLPRP